MTSLEAALRWYLVLMATTWAFAPWARWIGSGLSDRGATIARPLATLFLVWPIWMLGALGIVPFDGWLLITTMAVAAAIGWAMVIRPRGLERAWLRRLLIVEAGSLVCFLAYLWLRGFTPEILGTEKPMDVAFLASGMRTATIPPPDPWFSGQPINYYYLGYLLYGSIGRIAGVPPQFAFNLALGTIVSMTLAAAFGFAWNVLGVGLGRGLAIVGGALAAFFLAVSGNLYAPLRLLQDAGGTWRAWWWDSVTGIGWRASRIVCDGPRLDNRCQLPSIETINEFPFFSILLGDLHPHLMALPMTLVVLGLAWNLGNLARTDVWGTAWWLRLAATGVVVGALYPLNAWDYPTYLALSIAALRVGYRAFSVQFWQSAATLGVTSVAAWAPFWLRYDPPVREAATGLLSRVPILPGLATTIGIHQGERTGIAEYLTIFGVAYVAGVVLIATDARFRAGEDPRVMLLAALLTIVPAVVLAAPVLPLCGIPLAVAVHQLRREDALSPRAVALALFAVAWLLAIGVEFIYLRDAFDNRMNTLFKFYYQAWTLSALATAVAIPVVWATFPRRSLARAGLAAATGAALMAGLAYPIVASYQWTDGFSGWDGLDGLAYAENESADEVAAIRWLQQEVSPGDVVLEAAGCSYQPMGRLPFNRVSAFTGIPSVIGWGDNHQRQWRAGQPELIAEIRAREEDVAQMYANPDGQLTSDYGVDWLFVGDYETHDWQGECPTAGPYSGIEHAGFPGPEWREVFRGGDVRVYQRTASSR